MVAFTLKIGIENCDPVYDHMVFETRTASFSILQRHNSKARNHE